MVYFTMEITKVHSYYDTTAGWEDDHPGWYECSLTVNNAEQHLSMVKWMYDNLDNIERHCRWCLFLPVKGIGNSKFRFRYERDYIFFKLRWS